MSFRSDLRTFLLADGAISGLIGTRLYPRTLPQKPVLPAATEQVISGDREYAMDGPTGRAKPRVQYDFYALTALEADELFDAFEARLSGFQGVVGGHTIQGAFLEAERDGYEDGADAGTGSGAGLYRRSADFFIHYQ